jgi:hypothetical protein
LRAPRAQLRQGARRDMGHGIGMQRARDAVELAASGCLVALDGLRNSSSRFCNASRARDRWVFTEPSLQPITRAVVATSSSSRIRRLKASRCRRGRSRSAPTKRA